MSDAPQPGDKQPDDGPAQATPPGDQRREPPFVAFGIVAGTVIGGLVGLGVDAFLLGAGIGCATGVIIGAIAQVFHARR
jgi:F0F1-type ATP synthase assembly protein I